MCVFAAKRETYRRSTKPISVDVPQEMPKGNESKCNIYECKKKFLV